jgi:hypothetical protein
VWVRRNLWIVPILILAVPLAVVTIADLDDSNQIAAIGILTGHLFMLACIVVGYLIAKRKNRSKFLWAFLCLILNYVGVIIISILRGKVTAGPSKYQSSRSDGEITEFQPGAVSFRRNRG